MIITTITGLAAESTSSSTTLEGVLFNLGLPGVVIFVLGLYARSTLKASEERYSALIKASEERALRLEEDNRRMTDIMTSQMIPALTKATDTIVNATTLIAESKHERDRNAAVEEARRLIAAQQGGHP